MNDVAPSGRTLKQEHEMAHDDTAAHIWASLWSNILITIVKLGSAVWTGSGAMLAESIHTAADTVNQLLLLQGLREAQTPPDADHPLGHGRSAYFWSFMVALFMFLGGGVFSVYKGIQHVIHPEPVHDLPVAIVILGLSLLLDCWITYGNIRAFNNRRGREGFFSHLRSTKDSNLVVVFGENAAAVLGLAVALVSLLLAEVTGDPRFDAVGTLLVGVVLIGVAVFLAIEIKSLLTGEAADPRILETLRAEVNADPMVCEVLNAIAIQQGPGEVLVAAKVRVENSLDARGLVTVINDLEARFKSRCREVRWLFIEPDHTD